MILSKTLLFFWTTRADVILVQISFVAFSFTIQPNVLECLTSKVTNGCTRCILKVVRTSASIVCLSTLFSLVDGTESDHQLLKRMAYVAQLEIRSRSTLVPCSVKYDEPCWSLTQPNQSTTSTIISTSSIDEPMVNCISQPIKLDDLILITEPRSLSDMGDVSPRSHIDSFDALNFLARSIRASRPSHDAYCSRHTLRRDDLSAQSTLRSHGLHTQTHGWQSGQSHRRQHAIVVDRAVSL